MSEKIVTTVSKYATQKEIRPTYWRRFNVQADEKKETNQHGYDEGHRTPHR